MGIYERKRREREQRRDQILKAAKKVFSDKGFNRATMEEIAGEAELSPGTLYIYFKNKEELHTCLSIDLLEHIGNRINQVSEMDVSVDGKLDNLRDVFIDVYEYDAMILINLFHLQSGEVLKNLSDELMTQLKETSAKALRGIKAIVSQGIDQGVLVDEHPVAIADILWSTYSGVVLWVDSKRLLNDQKDFVKSTLKQAFDILKVGLEKA
jgi:AcrR family transcriptional regulator